jgi:hypothetical protein
MKLSPYRGLIIPSTDIIHPLQILKVGWQVKKNWFSTFKFLFQLEITGCTFPPYLPGFYFEITSRTIKSEKLIVTAVSPADRANTPKEPRYNS